MRAWRISGIAVGILFILAVARLAFLEHRGPAHQSIELSGGLPATMYLPDPGMPFYRLFPPPKANRPPVVVLMHGFSADREIMSVLARRMAQNGYAVLAIDAHGHGANRNPYSDTWAEGGVLREDFKTAVDYLRANEFVDGARIVVMGHSMGAGAAMDFATHEPDLSGAVMISGGWTLGPIRARNALFIFAEHDPVEAVQQTSSDLAAHLAGVNQIEIGKTYGDFAQGTAIEAERVPGETHVSIVHSVSAAATIIKWLDGIFGTQRNAPILMRDPRLSARRVALLLFIPLIAVFGALSGAMVERWAERPGGRDGWLGELTLVIVLIAALPLVANINPASFFPLVVGDVQVAWLGTAGIIAIGLLAITRRLDWTQLRSGAGMTIFAAILAAAALYLCQNAISVTFHRISFTPERLLMMIPGTAVMLPFWYAFETLVRRGGMVISTVLGLIGRLLILCLLVGGAFVGVMPFVLLLIVPILVVLFVMFEIFAAAAYSTSRNLALISIVETLWFVGILCVTDPIAFKL